VGTTGNSGSTTSVLSTGATASTVESAEYSSAIGLSDSTADSSASVVNRASGPVKRGVNPTALIVGAVNFVGTAEFTE